ncbi:hypothetical protein LF1_54620 [Rubripirellula obstinata]|uniref:Uncharacterized protein n=1 Tax=Rubripirellula obstinata TaxID=406547 RepID=A0A5B1CD37_9BACT|nr:hypothetical protein LF1_54620 [Rubripirellula obstinata]
MPRSQFTASRGLVVATIRAPSRITVCITEVAGFDVQAERKVCGRHSGACNGYPQHTIAMPSARASSTWVAVTSLES